MKRLLATTENVAALFLLAIALLTAGNVALRDLFSMQVPDWFDGSRLLQSIALFWGIAIDWVVWSALPSPRVLTGGAIVIGSGLYIIWRERQVALAAPIAARAAEGNVPP